MRRYPVEIVWSPLGQCGAPHLPRGCGCDGPPRLTTQKKETDQMLVDEVRTGPSLGESIPFLVSGRRACVAQSACGPIGPLQTVAPDGPRTSSAPVALSRYRFRSRPGFRHILRPVAGRTHAGRESAKPEFRRPILGLKGSSVLASNRRAESLLCIHRRLADAVACPRCGLSQ